VADTDALRIEFSLRGLDGVIVAALTVNTDPASLGYSLLFEGESLDAARGFPVCRASVAYPANGYAAMFGWTQMVRSTDGAGHDFEMDPIAIYRDVSTPFAWFGFLPELFDAPSRGERYDMDWEAHSFLCVSPDAVLTPRVQAVAGFRWGFSISNADITFAEPAVLDAGTWDSHLLLLRSSYPEWTFDAGFVT